MLPFKKLVITGMLGTLLLGSGLAVLYSKAGLMVDNIPASLALITTGLTVTYLALRGFALGFFSIGGTKHGEPGADRRNSTRKSIHKRILDRGPKVVVIGGGTGLSTLLRGLKHFTSNITAVVTVADDGGGSGVIRSELGMLPPGDIRNCILALADTEPVMERLMEYRFQGGSLKGQSFGNLFIAAMNGISGNFEEAVKRISQVLAVTGQVLPITLEDVVLYAQLRNGKVVKGESSIPQLVKEYKSPIHKVFVKPKSPEPLPEVLEAISCADAIVLGPGSLYTSIIPNLLARDIVECIYASDAVKIYVANIMTQPGETEGYTVSDHIKALEEHAGKKIIDVVIANSGHIDQSYIEKYAQDGAEPVNIDRDRIRPGIKLVSHDLVAIEKGYIRHSSLEIARLVTKLAIENQPGIMDYYYILTNMMVGR